MTGGLSKITVEIGGKVAASLGQSLKAAQAQVSSFGRNVSRTMNDAATSGKKSFKDIFSSDLWQQATVGATAFAGAVGLSVREAMKFDSAMADIRKAIDFEDGEKGVKRFGNELIKLSTELPYTAEQLTKIAAAAGFAGYAEQEIIPFTKTAAAMGVAFQMTAEQAGESMVAIRAAMGLTQPEVVELGDAINYLSDKFQGTVNAADLVEVTRRIGAIGKASGLAKEEVAGLGAAFLASGTPVEVAGTGLKNFLNALTKGDQATKKQVEALEAIFGADVSDDLAKGMQTNAEATIKKVIQGMAKLPADKRVSIAGALFGEESKAAIMPLLTNTKLLDQAFDLIADKSAFAGSMQKEFANQMNTSGAQAKIFQNGIQAMGISLGTALLPSLNAVMKAVGPIMVRFAEWAQNNQGLVTGIVLVGAALAGLIIALPVIAGVVSAIGTIGGAVAAAAPIVAGLGTVFAVIGSAITTGLIPAIGGFVSTAVAGLGSFAVAAGAAMLPLLPWIALIAGIGAGIYWVVKNWDLVKAALGSAWQAVVATWGQFTSWIGGVFQHGLAAVLNAWSGLSGWASGVFQGVVNAIQGIWNGYISFMQGVFNRVVAFFQQWGPAILAIMNPIPALVLGIFGKLPPGVQGVFDQVVDFIKQTPQRVASVGQLVIQAILDGLKAKATELFGWISGTWDRIKSFVGGGDEPAPSAGRRVPGRATGGPVRAGFPYIVGERRRELFVPGMDGAIVPRIARPVTAGAMAAILAGPMPAAAAPVNIAAPLPQQAPTAAPVTIHAPITINAAGGDPLEIRRQVELAFMDIQREIESSHRVLLND
jgi:TP901 family phage tail tape measure protein